MSVYSENEAPKPGFRFADGQKVFCFHGPTMYEARCVKAEFKEGKPIYFIHYHGWNKNWDEWVDEERLTEHNDENKKKAEQSKTPRNKKKLVGAVGAPVGKRKSAAMNDALASPSSNSPSLSSLKMEKDPSSETKHSGGKESSSAHKSSSQNSSISTPTTTPTTKQIKEEIKQESVPAVKGRRGKRPRRSGTEEVQISEFAKDIKIDMPTELKDVLATDMNNILRENLILKLPVVKSVEQFFEEYLKQRKEEIESGKLSSQSLEDENSVKKIIEISTYREVCSAIKRYFNEMLGNHLLYKPERSQFGDILRKITDVDHDKNSTDKNSTNFHDKFRSRKNSSATKTNDAHHHQESEITTAEKGQQPGKHLLDFYSPVYLLRLLTKLGPTLKITEIDERAIKPIVCVVNDLFAYMKQHRDQLFTSSNYEPAPLDHDRKAS